MRSNVPAQNPTNPATTRPTPPVRLAASRPRVGWASPSHSSRGRHSARPATPDKPSAANTTTIENDMNNTFGAKANEMSPRPNGATTLTSPRGADRSLKQRKECRPQTSRRNDHTPTQRRRGQSKHHHQSHKTTKTDATSPKAHQTGHPGRDQEQDSGRARSPHRPRRHQRRRRRHRHPSRAGRRREALCELHTSTRGDRRQRPHQRPAAPSRR